MPDNPFSLFYSPLSSAGGRAAAHAAGGRAEDAAAEHVEQPAHAAGGQAEEVAAAEHVERSASAEQPEQPADAPGVPGAGELKQSVQPAGAAAAGQAVDRDRFCLLSHRLSASLPRPSHRITHSDL